MAVLLSLSLAFQIVLATIGPSVASAQIARQYSPDRQARCDELTDFRSRDFPNSTRIDNPFFALVPGSQLTLEGRSSATGLPLPHRLTTTVTDLTKTINGVRAVVVLETDVSDGEMIEQELAFFAQDRRGNVWTLGEYPEEYEAGRFASAPNTWIAGLSRGKAGVDVPGEGVGRSSFLQAFAPNIIFDCGRVTQRDGTTLVIDEWDPAEPAHQLKRYVRGTGLVEVTPVNDPEGETLVAITRTTLNQRQLAEIRERAGPRGACLQDQRGLSPNFPDGQGQVDAQSRPIAGSAFAPISGSLLAFEYDEPSHRAVGVKYKIDFRQATRSAPAYFPFGGVVTTVGRRRLTERGHDRTSLNVWLRGLRPDTTAR
jgi:hypothetical protein